MNNRYNEPAVLPEDFDGTFKFTNYSDEDFMAMWDKVEYTFKANTTSPMVMNFTPLEIQNIRKKFAKELGTREFYKTEKFNKMNVHVMGCQPVTYTDDDLTTLIQRCLEPLAIVNAKTKVVQSKKIEDFNTRDGDGELITSVLDKGSSLIKEGSTPIKD